MFSGVAISSDETGRFIQSTCFPCMFAASKSCTASDEYLQSPFKVLTVTVVLLPSSFNSSRKVFFTKLP